MKPDCIKYSGYISRLGYGTICRSSGPVLVHRIVYCEQNGLTLDDIKGLVVRHTCDYPACVTPKHLVIGTHGDNMRDREERGRGAKGERQGQSKLTDDAFRYCREVFIKGDRLYGGAALGRRFGVTTTVMLEAIYGIQWAHVS